MIDPGSPWWVVAAAAVPSIASGIWVFWRWWVERSDKARDGSLTREQVLQRDLDARQATLSREANDLFERVRAELIRVQQRVVEAELERDRAYRICDAAEDHARAWKVRCHHLKHRLENAQTAINGLLIQSGRAPRQWPDETLPALENIAADNTRRLALPDTSTEAPSP